jgi:N-acetyl-1-D-myo-inositol-2-amino-2-deoxy-alpha-D-glucopyranoside deacetylase/mycothiol S-conjugate amidase
MCRIQDMKKYTLLFVGAHPDDETFGVGGTLAKYVLSGVSVYYACATRGEAGSVDVALLKGYENIGDLRWAELECACGILGLAGLYGLGYRDSGMTGSENNHHPQALAAAPVEEVAERIVKIIRDIRPQVVITFDPIGGYRHPDHIAIHRATVMAFQAAGDPASFPGAGAPYQPDKLYFQVMSRTLLKIAMNVLPLFGQDPRRFGRNRDIDITALASVDFPVHARVQLTKDARELQEKARACHISQVGSGPPRRMSLMGLVAKLAGQRDSFMRAYPPPVKGRLEHDLFEALE